MDSMDQEGALFKGPKHYAATAAKYMHPFKEIVGKRQRTRDDQQKAIPPQKVGNFVHLRHSTFHPSLAALDVAKLERFCANTFCIRQTLKKLPTVMLPVSMRMFSAPESISNLESACESASSLSAPAQCLPAY